MSIVPPNSVGVELWAGTLENNSGLICQSVEF